MWGMRASVAAILIGEEKTNKEVVISRVDQVEADLLRVAVIRDVRVLWHCYFHRPSTSAATLYQLYEIRVRSWIAVFILKYLHIFSHNPTTCVG